MKPRNFPARKLRRQARATEREGLRKLSADENAAAWWPTDACVRVGRHGRDSIGLPRRVRP